MDISFDERMDSVHILKSNDLRIFNYKGIFHKGHASNIKHYRITIVVFAFCDARVTDLPSKLDLIFMQNVTILPDNNCGIVRYTLFGSRIDSEKFSFAYIETFATASSPARCVFVEKLSVKSTCLYSYKTYRIKAIEIRI